VKPYAITKRKPPRWGVRNAAQAFCVCGWSGSHWYGEGMKANAHGELRFHRESCRVDEPAGRTLGRMAVEIELAKRT
jgi:hypothetical protein